MNVKRFFSRISKAKVLLMQVVILALVFSACQPAAEEAAPAAEEAASDTEAKDTILIPWNGVLTGPVAPDSTVSAQAVELAVKKANEKGGVCGGRKLEFVAYDNKADPKEAANIAEIIVSEDNVFGSISGWTSSGALAEAPILAEAEIPHLVVYGAAPDLIERAGPWAYRVYPSAEYQGRFFADMLNDNGIKKIAILYENEDYGVGLMKVAEAAILENGGEVVAKEAVLKDQTDLSSVVSKFKASGAKAVLTFVEYQTGAYYLMQADKMEFEAPTYGFDGLFSPALIDLAGDSAEGVITLASYSLETTTPLIADFVNSFQEEFGGLPNNPAGYAYDVTNIIIQGLEATDCAGGAALKEWLDTEYIGTEHQGITGTIVIGEDRERAYSQDMFTLIHVKDGKFVEMEE